MSCCNVGITREQAQLSTAAVAEQAALGLHVQPVHHTCWNLEQSSCCDADFARKPALLSTSAVACPATARQCVQQSATHELATQAQSLCASLKRVQALLNTGSRLYETRAYVLLRCRHCERADTTLHSSRWTYTLGSASTTAATYVPQSQANLLLRCRHYERAGTTQHSRRTCSVKTASTTSATHG